MPAGEFLDLDEATVVTVEQFTSMMNDEDVLNGSFSYSATAPLNEWNKRLLQNGHLASAAQKIYVSARVWFGSRMWKVVQLQYGITDGKFDFTLTIDNGIAANALKNTSLMQVVGNGNTANFQSQDDYRAYMKATAAAAPGIYPLVFFPVKNEIWCYTAEEQGTATYPGYSATLSNYINEWNPVTQSFVTDSHAPGVGISHLESPAFYVTYIFKRIITYLGYTPVGGFFTDPDIARLVMESPIGINTFGTVAIGDMFFYMPDIKLNDFIKAVRNKITGLLISFNETDKTCLVDTWTNILNSVSYTDLRPYQQLPSDNTYPPEVTGYSITEKEEDRDQLFKVSEGSPAPDPIVIGDGSTEIEQAISTTKMLIEPDMHYSLGTEVDYRLPHVQMPYYTASKYVLAEKVDYTDRNTFELRFLYYHGMKPNQAGHLYPYASADNLNWEEQPIGKYSLQLNSTTVLMAQRWYQFRLASKKKQVNYVLPEQVFVQMQNSRRVLYRDENNATISCLLDQFSADLGKNKMIQAQAILYTKPISNPTQQTAPVIPPVVDNGSVYVKLVQRNYQQFQTSDAELQTVGNTVDLYFTFWADQYATVPKNVTNLLVKVFRNKQGSPEYTNSDTSSTICTGQDIIFMGVATLNYTSNVFNPDINQFVDGPYFTQTYTLVDTGEYHIIP